jgi:hypothetical protein
LSIQNLDELVQFLGMELVIDDELTHPSVAYTDIEWRQARAV